MGCTVGSMAKARVSTARSTQKRSKLYVTAPVEGAEAGSSKYCADDEYVIACRRRMEQLRSECGSEAELRVQKSREHWTEVGRPSSDLELLHVANQQRFKRLLEPAVYLKPYTHTHKTRLHINSFYRHSFFVDYGDDLVVGEKIGEGGQAEIFKAAIRGKDGYVVKVLKPGYDLADLQRQWTIRSDNGLNYKKSSYDVHLCHMESGTLLRDGRFAFEMRRFWGDLRKLIDQKMKANTGHGPPFPLPQAL